MQDGMVSIAYIGCYAEKVKPLGRPSYARILIDIIMIDLVRVGGITQWMKVIGMAEAFNVPVVNHLILEIHVHLIAAIPNGLTVEYMPWTVTIVRGNPSDRERPNRRPQKSGLGLQFDAEAIRRYQIG